MSHHAAWVAACAGLPLPPALSYAFREQRLDVYAAAQNGLVRVVRDPNKRSKFIDFIDYHAEPTDKEQATYRSTWSMNEAKPCPT